MLKTLEGVYSRGKFEFEEALPELHDPTPVMVTFLESRPVDLRALGIDESEAADLHDRLATFEEDWNSPEMDVYDSYDAAKTRAR